MSHKKHNLNCHMNCHLSQRMNRHMCQNMRGKFSAVAVDLDKTALRSDCTISSETIRAFEQLKREGVEIIICSGRSVREIEYHASNLPRGRYIVALNGAQVYDTHCGAPVFYERFAQETAVRVAAYFERRDDLFFQMYGDEILYTTPKSRGVLESCGLAPEVLCMTLGELSVEPRLCERLAAGLRADKFVAISPCADAIEAARRGLADIPGISFTRSHGNSLEVMPEGVDKGVGLRRALELLGISKSQVLAIGDSENDLPMFREAEVCVAMGNSGEDVRRAADFVTCDNDGDGVAVAVFVYACAIERGFS